MNDSNINIVTTTLQGGREPGAWQRVLVEKPLDADALKTKFKAFVDMLEGIFDDSGLSAVVTKSDFLLDELNFLAEIGPDGDFRLRGDCSDHTGGVRLVLRRRRTNQNASQNLLTSKPGKDELKVVVGSSVESDTVKVDIVHGVIDANILPTPLVVAIVGA